MTLLGGVNGGVQEALALSKTEVEQARKLEDEVFTLKRDIVHKNDELKERFAAMWAEFEPKMKADPKEAKRWARFQDNRRQINKLTGDLRKCQTARSEAESTNKGLRKRLRGLGEDIAA